MFNGVTMNTPGLWSVKDNLGALVTSFKVQVWSGGSWTLDNSLVMVFTDSANFRRDLANVFGATDISTTLILGDITFDLGIPAAYCAKADLSNGIGLGNVPVALVDLAVTGKDKGNNAFTPDTTARTVLVTDKTELKTPAAAGGIVGVGDGDRTFTALAVVTQNHDDHAGAEGQDLGPTNYGLGCNFPNDIHVH